MSGNKYANLPDIDTAPDVYETEDVLPSSQKAGDSDDEEAALAGRAIARGRHVEAISKEELDMSNLIRADEASKIFKKAEKRHHRTRTHYAYPPSPTESSSADEAAQKVPHPVSLSGRLSMLQKELSALEQELADPSNPLIQKEREEGDVDPGELIRGLMGVRNRLEKIRKEKEGRGRLVGLVLGDVTGADDASSTVKERDNSANETGHEEKKKKSDVRGIIEIDKRVGELEKLVGSSTALLDESSPLPPPLLPLITRLSSQLNLLTQPRNIDSISRRLKILLSDLERTTSAQAHTHRRNSSQSPPQANGPTQGKQTHEQLMPLLLRLGPFLPQIPHILTRLRTLSDLHAAAGNFQGTLEDMEQEQQKIRSGLLELTEAVKTVEANMDENRDVVRGNVTGLESRINVLTGRLEALKRDEPR